MIEPFYMLACEPMTIAALTIGLSAVGTGASLAAQSAAAGAQKKHQQQLATARNKEFVQQSEAANQELAQQREANARRLFEATQASRKAEATAAASAAASGVSGASVEALLREFRAQEGLFREATARQNQLLKVGTTERINQGRTATKTGNVSINAPVAGPNFVGELLQLGVTSLGAVQTAKLAKERRGTTNG